MSVKSLFLLLACGLSLILSSLPFSRADSFTIFPATVYGTTTVFSANYSDFRFDEPANISLNVLATFNNENVSAVNITAIQVRLYYTSVNLTQMTAFSSSRQDAYAYADWLSTDYYGASSESYPIPPPLTISRSSNDTGSSSRITENLALIYQSSFDHDVMSRLYVQTTLCYLDQYGDIIAANSTPGSESGYYWLLYSGEEEAPYATVRAKTVQPWFQKPEMIASILGSTGIVVGIIGVVSVRRRKSRKPSSTKDRASAAPFS